MEGGRGQEEEKRSWILSSLKLLVMFCIMWLFVVWIVDGNSLFVVRMGGGFSLSLRSGFFQS